MEPGTRLGPYEIVAFIGAGGMGEVWRALDERLDREVALKVLPADTLTDQNAKARLLREARMASRLNHPNICTVYDVGEADGRANIAMELVEGRPLTALFLAGGLPIEKVLRYGQQLADALAHAHERGVVHRDLKCGNVIVTPEGRAKVLDFGLAKRLVRESLDGTAEPTESLLTGPGTIVGTLPYMSPEQLRGENADARSDIWSLGVMLHEMAAGVRPFRGNTGYELSSAILNEPAPALPAAVPPALVAVVERCLTKEPGQRYQRGGEVRAALEAAASGETLPTWPALRSKIARNRRLMPAVLLTVLIAALVGTDVGGVRSRLFGRAVGQRTIRMAVLPFSNLSGDSEQEYLADGITQEMISQLGRLHPDGLSVIARTSVMRYKSGDTPVDEIGRELRVEYVLEGSARREGGRLRIAAELIEVQGQTQLWAETYERKVEGILIVQSEVALRVAQSLALELLPAERARLASAGKVHPEVYDWCLRGTYHWQKLGAADLDVAQRYFEMARAEDPSYAPAHQGLAWVWAARQQIGASAPREAGPRAKAAALRAIALDESSAGAHEAMAVVLTWTDWDWAGAEAEWRRALALDPNAATTHAYYAHFLAVVGRVDEALSHSEKAIELDPFNALYHGLYGVVLLRDRRFDEAVAEGQKAQSLDPRMGLAYSVQQYAFIATGKREEQLADQRRRIARDPGRVAAFEAGLSEGGYEGAQRRLAELLAARYEEAGGVPNFGAKRVYMPYPIALRYLDAGDYDRAMVWLEKGYEVRDPSLPYVCMPVWDPLHSDPRFQALLRRLNLPQR